jgi:N-methylhydantoinase A
VTDADVVLGHLDARRFLGGRMKGRPELAHDAVARVARHLGVTPLEAAIGVHRIINTHMAVGLRMTLQAKGCDPEKFVLVAFGGAGPVHACWLAEDVGIPRILVPPHPGIACAMGLLQTDVMHVYMQSYLIRIDRAPAGEVNERLQRLTARALEDATVEGFLPEQLQLHRELDIRYPHQGYELALECPGGMLTEEDLSRLRRDFDTVHERVYGVAAPDEPVEIVNVRVRSVVPGQPLVAPRGSVEKDVALPARSDERDAYFEASHAFVRTPVYDRLSLRPGARLPGPAIIEQLDSTTVIAPGWNGEIDAYGHIVLVKGRRAGRHAR